MTKNNTNTTFDTARENSRLGRVLTRCGTRVRELATGSRLVAVVPTGIGRRVSGGSGDSSDFESEPEPGQSSTRDTEDGTLSSARSGSTLWRRVDAIRSRFTTPTTAAVDRAGVTRLADAIKRYVTSSWGYRWLTTEPEPDVIVIDLRKTRSVGPAISILDRTIDRLFATAPTSSVTALCSSFATVVRARPIRVASLGLLATTAASLLALVATATITLPLVVVHFGLSLLAGLGVRSSRSLEEVLESRVVSVLVAAFEPPEPPESRSVSDRPRDDGADTTEPADE